MSFVPNVPKRGSESDLTKGALENVNLGLSLVNLFCNYKIYASLCFDIISWSIFLSTFFKDFLILLLIESSFESNLYLSLLHLF